MPASERRIAANRRNALRSTGPRTAAGKARVATNGATHGLSGAHLVIADHERPAFDSLHDNLLREIDPRSPAEHTAFRQLVHAAWNMRRFHFLESAEPDLEKLERLQRYGAKARCAFRRALRDLRDLHSSRAIDLLEQTPDDWRNTLRLSRRLITVNAELTNRSK